MGLLGNILGGGKKKEQTQNLIAMQNFLYSTGSNSLTKTPQQVLNKASSFVNNRKDKLAKSFEKMNNADNPKKFFDSLTNANDIIKEMNYFNSISGGIIRGLDEIVDNFNNDLPNDINNMIDRTWESFRLDAIKLTKEDSKKKKLQSFFELMDIYSNRMYPQNLEHIEEIKTQNESLIK